MLNLIPTTSGNNMVDRETALFWFRRDLRTPDNAGLYHALKENTTVLGLFIFDSEILDGLPDKSDGRVDFIHQSLSALKTSLEEMGSSLLIIHGNPVDVFKHLTPKAVYTNHDYEPYSRRRDDSVTKILQGKNIPFLTFKDQVIFEKSEIVKGDSSPYTVFTPYSRRWKSHLTPFYYKSFPVEKYFSHLKKITPLPMLTLASIGFEKSGIQFPDRKIKQSVIEQYHERRNFPATAGTTRLSVHLRFGTISIRKLVQVALKKNETWLNELIWREFYQMILWHFPQVETRSFKPAYDKVRWRNDEQEFQRWCEGNTGYPIVDAGMRELNATGFMHNRVRMITASFLTKHLLIDWRWGEAYFAKKLLDFDLASNNGGWQWAAGSGCDAAPYFRVFSPQLQMEKFDPLMEYTRKWVPEIDQADYTKPIVDHAVARDRAIKVYREALR